MSAYQRLAWASVAAVVALVVTACGSTSGPATNPATATDPAPTANSAYPYEPGGVTYNGDEGAVYVFSIPAGSYSQNLQVSYDPANDPDDTGECQFGGELDWQSGAGATFPLFNGIVQAQVPIDGPAFTEPLAAGDYALHIYPETTCSWTFELAG